uniref:Uncharacterized protein n=1 Tax=Branchiostoma floridae TaxID=7739 RepID=C3XUZ0_BRAFL|eukprot:XP_002611907.1 hypothetical protein BRAFLDRAFT_106503 [Branchiostoma floridae]
MDDCNYVLTQSVSKLQGAAGKPVLKALLAVSSDVNDDVPVRRQLEGRHHAVGLGTKILLGKTHAARCLMVQCHPLCTGALLLTIVFHCALSHWEPAQMVAASAQLRPWVLWGGVGCTAVYWLDTFLTMAHMTPRGFFRLPHNILHVILLVLLTSDYVIYT